MREDVWIVLIDGQYVGTVVAVTKAEAHAEAVFVWGGGSPTGLVVKRARTLSAEQRKHNDAK